jgi:hypothetical protein
MDTKVQCDTLNGETILYVAKSGPKLTVWKEKKSNHEVGHYEDRTRDLSIVSVTFLE